VTAGHLNGPIRPKPDGERKDLHADPYADSSDAMSTVVVVKIVVSGSARGSRAAESSTGNSWTG